MNKKLLREIEISGVSVLSEDKAKNTMNILAPWTEADKLNKNNRKYPLALLQREVDKIQEKINSGMLVGNADHPGTGFANIENASHIVKKLWLDKSGKGFAELKILPTPKGKIIQTIISENGRLGLSSRGYGNVDPTTRIVEKNFSLTGLDVVMNPSFDTATFNKENIFESADFVQDKKEKVVKEVGLKSKKDLMWLIYNRDCNRNLFRGSFEEWKGLNEK